MKRLATMRSMSFEMMIGSSWVYRNWQRQGPMLFLRRDVTKACFNWIGKTPCRNERSQSDRIEQMVAGMRLSSHVGIGSSKQDFAGIVDSNFVNSGTVVGVNSARSGTSLVVMTGAVDVEVDARMFIALSMKNLAKSSAPSLPMADFVGGCSMLSTFIM